MEVEFVACQRKGKNRIGNLRYFDELFFFDKPKCLKTSNYPNVFKF